MTSSLFSDFVRPVCLPTGPVPHKDLIGEAFTVSGWGLTSSHPKKFPEYLLYVSIPALDNNKCKGQLSRKLLDSQLCLGDQTGKVSLLV